MGGVIRGGRHDLHGKDSHIYRALRKAVVDGHRAQHGDWCPGYNVPAHQATDLCADHLVAVALGGDPAGPFGVLCRSCNSRKGKGLQRVSIPATRSRVWF